MNQVWIVEQSSGSYDDYRSWPVGAFPTKEEAQEWVKVNQPLFKESLVKQDDEASEYMSLIDALMEKHDYPSGKDKYQGEYFDKVKVLQKSWADLGKATSHSYQEWGYSLNTDPIPFYSHGPDTV